MTKTELREKDLMEKSMNRKERLQVVAIAIIVIATLLGIICLFLELPIGPSVAVAMIFVVALVVAIFLQKFLEEEYAEYTRRYGPIYRSRYL